MLDDMLRLQRTVFTFIPLEECYSKFVETLLQIGSFFLYFQVEDVKVSKKYLKDVKNAEELVLNSARTFFNSAVSAEDSNMRIANEM